MIAQVAPASESLAQRQRSHVLSSLVGLGRSTLTGMLCTQGKTDCDWSADYRFYSHERLETQALWQKIRQEVVSLNGSQAPLVVGIDDTLIRKRGRKIPGVSYRRDPLSPPFSCNFVLGQRFIQLSGAVASADGSARMIPIDFSHAPTPKKPKPKAPDQLWEDFHKAQKQMKLSKVAVERLTLLHDQLSQPFIAVGDGGYTNSCVLKALPQPISFIGRIRKDAKLYKLPDSQPSKGRKRCYGDELPTPEKIRQDDSIAWQSVQAFASGKTHDFRIKAIPTLRARMDGGKRNYTLIVIAPLAYRPRKGAKLLYRQPAYLLCSDPQLSISQILQAYLWRWDIEVNFRDEKTLLGVGQPQVRNPHSIDLIPQLQVASYALLLLAATKISSQEPSFSMAPPKWRSKLPPKRSPTASLINQLRYDLWNNQISQKHFSNFPSSAPTTSKSHKLDFNLTHALFRAAA